MIKQVKWVKLLCCGEQWLGKTVWVASPSGKSKPVCRVPFAQGPGRTWWVIQEDGETRCVPQGDLTLGENNPRFELYVIAVCQRTTAGATHTEDKPCKEPGKMQMVSMPNNPTQPISSY